MNYHKVGKKEKPFTSRVLSVRMQNSAQQDKEWQEIITFIQSTSFGRKNSNKASSLSNVDSVVGCLLKLFRSLSTDCFATLPKLNIKAEISKLQTRIILFVKNITIATGFSSHAVKFFNAANYGKFNVTALIPCGRGSSQSVTHFKF